MTEEEFRKIKVGDVLTYRGMEFEVIHTERFTDFERKPPEVCTWKCHFDNGTNAQINDDICFLNMKERGA